ncbi:MAG: hypothetical protein IRY99_10715, partial [Isosphaeraceae bacterium]|nr:hypothetical protein [Isosphaeraceae bacterium]
AYRPTLDPLEERLVLTAIPRPDHVVVVVEENRGYNQIIGSPAAPYINSLAQQGASFTQAFGETHPSQPNYLYFFSGDNQGITNNTIPTQPLSTPNLGASLIQAGLSFGGYAQGLPAIGSTVNQAGAYSRLWAPWVNWQGGAANAIPPESNMPFTSFPTDFSQLPTVSFVVADGDHNMHNGVDPAAIQTADTWLHDNLDAYVQWAQTHNSLLIITWDEDDFTPLNQIPTIFVGPMVRAGQYSETINHLNILRTIEDMYGLPYVGASATADPIADIWATSPPSVDLSWSGAVGPVDALAYQLDQQLGLFSDGNYDDNWGGRNERWIQGNGGQWYFLTPDGGFYGWDGSGTASGPLLALLDPSYWADPSQLYNAAPPASMAVGTDFNVSRTYNVAGGPIGPNFTIAYYRSSDSTFGNADDVLLGTEAITTAADKALGSHEGMSPALRITVPGTYYIFARIDDGNTVTESDETNNIATPTILVVNQAS